MYDNDREKIRYDLFQKKNSIFDVMHDWIIEIENDVTLNAFFVKIENYMKLHKLKRNIKKKLLIISMKSFEIVSEFYHKIFKLWKKAKVIDENRMNQFRIVVKSIIVNTLLSRRYTDMKVMFEVIKKVENQKNDLNSRYSREIKSQKDLDRSQANSIKSISFKLNQRQNKSSKKVKLLTSEHSNSQFESVSTKLAKWTDSWYETEKNFEKLIEKIKSQLIKQKRCWNCREFDHKESDFVCINYDRKKKLNVAKADYDFDSDSDKSKKE
jgi:Txe/YoeB family toxin of Txe-Axe toxin-antitoxin module